MKIYKNLHKFCNFLGIYLSVIAVFYLIVNVYFIIWFTILFIYAKFGLL